MQVGQFRFRGDDPHWFGCCAAQYTVRRNTDPLSESVTKLDAVGLFAHRQNEVEQFLDRRSCGSGSYGLALGFIVG